MTITHGHRLGILIVGLLWLGATATAEEALYRQEPFDRITLDAQNNGVVLEVRPLLFTDRIVPEHPSPQDKFTFFLIDQPLKTYEVSWESVAKVELFEQILLAEAKRLAASGKGSEAYDYFRHLAAKYSKLPGLDSAYNDFLYEEAKQRRRNNDLAGALAALRELHDRDPQRPGLDKAMGAITDQMIQQHAATQNYPPARQLLKNLAVWYPQEPTVAKWESQLQQAAQGLLKDAQKSLAAGDFRKADDVARRLIFVWPQLPGAQAVAQALFQKYPRVVLAVSMPAVAMDPDRFDDWASRRSARLIHRGLAEVAAVKSQGNSYACPSGEMRFDPKTSRVAVKIKPGQRWQGADATVESYDVARRLAAMLTPGDHAYRPDLAELVTGLEVADPANLTIALARPHLCPEGLLRTMFVPYSATSAQRDPAEVNHFSNGPYDFELSSAAETVYRIRQMGTSGSSRPQEIVERHFAESGKAAAALRQGQIQLIDRINPWELSAWKGVKGISVEAYGMPLVHCLVPNPNRPLTAQRSMRRALETGINREAILRALVGNREVPGCQLISGPFPAKLGDSTDTLPAYDTSIVPRRHDPRLASILVRETLEALPKSQAAVVSLVLAHPAHSIARTACLAMRQDLEKVGVSLQLRELSLGAPSRPADDVDLVYAELAMFEPIVDARRLLGEQGLIGGCSPAMSLALRQVAEANDWAQVRTRLRRVHRLCHDESAVIPLWQLTDHFAYQETLKGVGKGLISLYDNVEQWNVEFSYPGQ